MNIYQHFSAVGFCNTYLVANTATGEAILIDPGSVEIQLINLLESNGYTLKGVLLTHSHLAHTEGLGTLEKIYDYALYASSNATLETPFIPLVDREQFTVAGCTVEAIQIPGHSVDSLIYRIQGALFSGDVLGSGAIGSTGSLRARSELLQALAEKIFPLAGQTLLFPGHGSPSKLRIEQLFNPALKSYYAEQAAE